MATGLDDRVNIIALASPSFIDEISAREFFLFSGEGGREDLVEIESQSGDAGASACAREPRNRFSDTTDLPRTHRISIFDGILSPLRLPFPTDE